MTPIRGLAALFVAAACTACAGGASLGAGPEPATRAQRAIDALGREDFSAARDDLTWLVSRCDAGRHRRRALLLLAAAELDPANPAASPSEAARAARAYLLLPDAEEGQVPLARALYRLATDLGGLESGGVAGGEGASSAGDMLECVTQPEGDQASLVPATATTTAARVHALEAALSSRSDSLAVLEARADSLQSHTRALEAEIERVANLLRNGIAPPR